MAFSGTISQTVFDTRKVIEHAARRCKVPAETLTAEHVDIANGALYLFLSDLANQGAPLWCIEKNIMPLYEGVGDVVMPVGTVDVLNFNLRYLQEVTGTNTDTATRRTVEFQTETFVTTVGVLWSAASVPLTLSRSADGVTWTVIQTETPSAAAGEWTWFDLDSSIADLYFRVEASSGTLSYSRLFLGNTPTEVPMARINRDDYTNLPNKSIQSYRPVQFWFDRQVRLPVMRLWPVPNAAATLQQIVIWRQRHIMDVGAMSQEIEVPQRWYEAVVAGLAVKLAYELPQVDIQMAPILEQRAAAALFNAQAEERDNSPMFLTPNIGVYTR